jgi:hypothetical protein
MFNNLLDKKTKIQRPVYQKKAGISRHKEILGDLDGKD